MWSDIKHVVLSFGLVATSTVGGMLLHSSTTTTVQPENATATTDSIKLQAEKIRLAQQTQEARLVEIESSATRAAQAEIAAHTGVISTNTSPSTASSTAAATAAVEARAAADAAAAAEAKRQADAAALALQQQQIAEQQAQYAAQMQAQMFSQMQSRQSRAS